MILYTFEYTIASLILIVLIVLLYMWEIMKGGGYTGEIMKGEGGRET